MRPFAVFRLKFLVANFIAYILDDTAYILVSLAQQTVLFDTPGVKIIVQLARLGVGQFQFADKFREPLFLTA